MITDIILSICAGILGAVSYHIGYKHGMKAAKEREKDV